MKALTLLLSFMAVFNFTSAALGVQQHFFVKIPNGSHIYLQTPDNQFFMGVLYHDGVHSIAKVVVRDGENLNLYGNLQPFNHNTNFISTEYRCYIPLRNSFFLTSSLHAFNIQDDALRRMSISVLINPQEPHNLLMGMLQCVLGDLPAWIPRRRGGNAGTVLGMRADRFLNTGSSAF